MKAHEIAELTRGLVDSTPDGVIVFDDRHRVVFVNEAAERMFGYTREEFPHLEIGRLMPERFRIRHHARVGDFWANPQARPMGAGLELFALDKQGREFEVEISLSPIEIGAVKLVGAIVRDVTELRRAQQANAWLTAIVQSTGDAIVGVDSDGVIVSWNPGAEQLYGYLENEVLGRPEELLTSPGHKHEQEDIRARALAGEIVGQSPSEALRKDGSSFPVETTASPILGSRGVPVGVARIVRDATERARFEQELRFFADFDLLTGLFNRRRFGEELARHVAYVARYPEAGGALLLGDLDSFKRVNDTLGHKAGDELIAAVARLLRGRLRETDVLARLGGDEFAVLLPRVGVEQATAVAQALLTAVSELELVIGGRRIRTTVSIGVAPVSAELSGEDSLAAADLAMYEAKGIGRNRVSAAAIGRQADADTAPPVGWGQRLRAALEEERLEAYSQPIVEISSGRITRYELLLRLREDGRLVPPGAFINIAERLGLIEEIDRRAFAHALALLADDPSGEISYHVNLSGSSILSPGLLDFFADELAARSLDPARLTFELSETAAIADLNAAQGFARGLAEIGCTLALDDFGSGFGSFTYLKYIPLRFLKIASDFIARLAESRSDRLLVKAIIDVAHGMQLQAIAEHVTSEPTTQLLREFGADYGQGYHLGEPLALSRPTRG